MAGTSQCTQSTKPSMAVLEAVLKDPAWHEHLNERACTKPSMAVLEAVLKDPA